MEFKTKSNFRMAQIQIMNMVNQGISRNVSVGDIKIIATASINATQLFLSEKEVNILRTQLDERLFDALQNNQYLH